MKRIVPALLLVLAGCAAELPPDEAALGPDGKADGFGAASGALEHTPEGVGILRMLNEPSTDVVLLDEHLDARAASNLIAHRDGPDGVYEEGAGDDDPFDSIEEVDDVSWVGPAALEQLRELASWLDFVPGPDGLLGEYDGIAFTVSEAERALANANDLDEETLRDGVGLTSPMIDSVVGARPIPNVGVLAELWYVGPRSLEKLRDFGAAPPGGEPCESSAECTDGLSCIGIPHYGYPAIGACQSTAGLPGEGNPCAADADCGGGLFCSGLTVYDGAGFCRADWMRTTVVDGGAGGIPGVPADTATASTVLVRGQATVPEDILVDAGFEHSDPRALRIWLRNPLGTEALLWDGPNAPADAVFDPHWVVLGIPRDEDVNGFWSLAYQNVTGGGEGVLDGWSITVSSRWD